MENQIIKLRNIYENTGMAIYYPLTPISVDTVFEKVIEQIIDSVIVDRREMFNIILYFTATTKGETGDWALKTGRLEQIFGVKLILE